LRDNTEFDARDGTVHENAEYVHARVNGVRVVGEVVDAGRDRGRRYVVVRDSAGLRRSVRPSRPTHAVVETGDAPEVSP
jgi:acyl-coenzyme A thioesterase PaaI-like protein